MSVSEGSWWGYVALSRPLNGSWCPEPEARPAELKSYSELLSASTSCLWVALLPAFHSTTGLPPQTPCPFPQAIAPPCSFPSCVSLTGHMKNQRAQVPPTWKAHQDLSSPPAALLCFPNGDGHHPQAPSHGIRGPTWPSLPGSHLSPIAFICCYKLCRTACPLHVFIPAMFLVWPAHSPIPCLTVLFPSLPLCHSHDCHGSA